MRLRAFVVQGAEGGAAAHSLLSKEPSITMEAHGSPVTDPSCPGALRSGFGAAWESDPALSLLPPLQRLTSHSGNWFSMGPGLPSPT